MIESVVSAQGVRSLGSVNAYVDAISFGQGQALSPKMTVNIELAISGKSNYSGLEKWDDWVIGPILRIAPRYYYNYQARIVRDKNVRNNSADYLTLCFDYQPGRLKIDNRITVTSLFTAPKWGMKRAIGRHFTFETAIGPGIYLSEIEQSFRTMLPIELKLGYTYQKRFFIPKSVAQRSN